MRLERAAGRPRVPSNVSYYVGTRQNTPAPESNVSVWVGDDKKPASQTGKGNLDFETNSDSD